MLDKYSAQKRTAGNIARPVAVPTGERLNMLLACLLSIGTNPKR